MTLAIAQALVVSEIEKALVENRTSDCPTELVTAEFRDGGIAVEVVFGVKP